MRSISVLVSTTRWQSRADFALPNNEGVVFSATLKTVYFIGFALILIAYTGTAVLAQSGNGATVYSEQRFEESGPSPEMDRPGAYPVSPPASASTHPFMNQGNVQFQHHRNLIPVVPMQQMSSTNSPEAAIPKYFDDKRELREHSLGNFLGGSSGYYSGASPHASPPSSSTAPATAPASSYAPAVGTMPSSSYPTTSPTGGSFSSPNLTGMAASRNEHFVYSYYRRSEREAKRAYSASLRASHDKDEVERRRAASEAHYAARTAQYSYDRIFRAAKNGDPVARQYVDRARNAAMRARDDAARAQEDAERPIDESVDR